MKLGHKLLLLFAFLTSSYLHSQEMISDTLVTSNSQIIIYPVFHGSLVLEIGGKIIYVDPYNGAERYTKFGKADLVLITHKHGDHFDEKTLKGIDASGVDFITPEIISAQLTDLLGVESKVMKNGDTQLWNGVEITAFPMYNLPNDENAWHKKGEGNGYLLKYAGKVIYIAGDTEDIPEMRALKDVDVSFICMNLPFTMTVEQAADAVLAFKPKVVYPYHYRSRDGFSDIQKFKEIVEKENKEIEVRLRDWYVD